ncbi:MAG: hypothetical protein ACT4PV_16460 [Planctomycetaceae bacterium]
MKWLAFTAVCVFSLVLLGILAVDERNVVWEGDKSFCPYCRSELNHYAFACKECRHSVDWVSHAQPCRACLDRDAAELLKAKFAALQITGPELPAALDEFNRAYFLSLDAGACGYCGGLGEVKENGAQESPCPICLGQDRCIACGGDRVVVFGDPEAHRRSVERRLAREEAIRRAELLGIPVPQSELLREDLVALTGFAEAATLRDGEGRTLAELARGRLQRAAASLEAAAHPPPAPPSETPAGS